MSNEQWEQVYARLARAGRAAPHHAGVRQHAAHGRARGAPPRRDSSARNTSPRTTAASRKELRLDAEQRLKRGELKVLVATASLELGIDIGDVDLVCQLGSPRSIATFLQRVGRSGHAVGGVPKGRLFPQSRDELVECAALLDCVRRGELDALRDAAGAARRAGAADRRRGRAAANGTRTRCSRWCAAPGRTRELPREDFDAVVRMLAEGFTTRRGTRAGYLHRDAVHKRLRGAQGRAHDRGDVGRHHPRHRRLRGAARAAGARRSAPSTRTSRSRASPATSSSSATPATGSCASSPAACAWRTRRARRRASRSGWARRRAAPTSCRSACRACARRSAERCSTQGDEHADRLAAPTDVGLDEATPRASSSTTSRASTPRSARCRRSSAS